MVEEEFDPGRDGKELYDFERDVVGEYASMGQGYTSPLMARVSQSRLTLELLQEEVPRVQAGRDASKVLDGSGAASLGGGELERLRQARREGERAKERLFAAALPLIRVVAVKEWRRRQQWGSQVSLEDLVQDANMGFLKGLAAFKPEAMKRSPTNYLGQWMLVEMRRSSESMDHDLKVGRDAGERFRRIRALRSRLLVDLGREPTDEEVAEASRDPEYATRPSMLGPAPEAGEGRKALGVTVQQVVEERDARGRVGHTARLVPSDGEDGPGRFTVDPEKAVLGGGPEGADPGHVLAEDAGKRMVVAMVARVIRTIGMPEEQSQIVALRYGLPPNEGEMSVREISRRVGVHRERVVRVLDAFAGEMTAVGGPFHRMVSSLSEDDLDSVGLLWAVETLGPWDAEAGSKHRTPKVLVERRELGEAGGEPEEGVSTVTDGFLAWYVCPRPSHKFSSLYAAESEAPLGRLCPRCGSQSVLSNGSGGVPGR